MTPRSSRSHSIAVPAESITASVPQVARPPPGRRRWERCRHRRPATAGPTARPGALVEHAAGAEGRLGQAGQGAALTDQRGLLVPGHPADGGCAGQRCVADRTRGVDDRRQDRRGDP